MAYISKTRGSILSKRSLNARYSAFLHRSPNFASTTVEISCQALQEISRIKLICYDLGFCASDFFSPKINLYIAEIKG